MSVDTIDNFKSLIGQKKGIARPNLFRVKLPTLPGASGEEMNILCKDVTLPGRQIMTNDRVVGIKRAKVPYGYAVEDVSMTFYVLNDYGVKEYFEAWQSLAVNQNSYEVGYQRGPGGYSRTIQIEQLKKVDKVPSALQTRSFARSALVPRIEDLGIFSDFYDFGAGLADIVIYKCELIDAFPTTVNSINLTNELDGVVELNVQLSYTDWENKQFASPTNLNQFIQQGVRSFIGSIF